MCALSAQDWHARFTQQARWTAPLRRYLYEKVELESAARVLEVGCGTGAILSDLQSYFERTQVHGLDLDARYLSLAQEHASGAHLVRGDAHQMPYTSGGFDLVACHFLLMWVNEPGDVMAEMVRLLRPQGAILALAEPDYGGRIDYPEELTTLGVWQEEALIAQGAHSRMGRGLGALLREAGLIEVEHGVLGGQWRGSPSLEEWQREWQVIHADLAAHIDKEKLRDLEEIDRLATQNDKRTLYIPTFYACGRKPSTSN